MGHLVEFEDIVLRDFARFEPFEFENFPKLNSKTFSIVKVTFECFVNNILSRVRVLSTFSAQGGVEKISKSGANLAKWDKLEQFYKSTS